MRLLHPLMPFITEEIWQHLPHEGESITVAAWPTVNPAFNFQAEAGDMKLLMDIIRSVRNIRAEVNTPMSKKVPLFISAKDAVTASVLEAIKAYIEKFCNPETLTIGEGIRSTSSSNVSCCFWRGIILTTSRPNQYRGRNCSFRKRA